MTIITERMTAVLNRPIVVFLIGMRINSLWKVHKWWPVATAMPRMLRELAANPQSGYLSGEMWFGRTTLMLQYWTSFEALEAYARDRVQAHLPAWAEFNRRVGSGGDVGIWHETYRVAPGDCETVYHNMPRFGLARVAPWVEAAGAYKNAASRMRNGRTGLRGL